MRNPDAFDAFYKDARDRLLLQTYALTGDLPASRTAVRGLLRRGLAPLAQGLAAGRPGGLGASARLGARAAPAHRPALAPRQGPRPRASRARSTRSGRLPLTQRKMLLLTHLTRLSLDDVAREVGLTRAGAERELQIATAQLALHRDVPTTSDPLPVRADADARRARCAGRGATIMRRAGAARRRTHTTVGAVAAVAALGLTGCAGDRRGGRPPDAGPRGGRAARRRVRRRGAERDERARGPAGHAAAERDAAALGGRRAGRRAGAGARPAPPRTPAATGWSCPASRSGTPTPAARPRWCARSTPRRAARRPAVSATQVAEVSLEHRARRPGLRHHRRLVRRLHGPPRPAAVHAAGRPRRATRRCCSCCAPGTRP